MTPVPESGGLLVSTLVSTPVPMPVPMPALGLVPALGAVPVRGLRAMPVLLPGVLLVRVSGGVLVVMSGGSPLPVLVAMAGAVPVRHRLRCWS